MSGAAILSITMAPDGNPIVAGSADGNCNAGGWSTGYAQILCL